MHHIVEDGAEREHVAGCSSCRDGETVPFECSAQLRGKIERRAAFYGRTWDEELNHILAVAYEIREPDADDEDMSRRLRLMRKQGLLPNQQLAKTQSRLSSLRRLPSGVILCPPTTVRQVCDIYLEYGLKGRSSYGNVRRTIRHTIENSELGDMNISDLTTGIIKRWHSSMASRHVTANKGLKVLRTAIRLCKDFELLDLTKDPTDDIQKFHEDSRERYVTPSEMPRLLYALKTSAPRDQAFFLIILGTASRPGEVSLMRWRDLDFVDMRWRKPTSKTGQPQEILLSPLVYRLLRELPEVSEFVFPGDDLSRPWASCTYQKCWRSIRQAAKLPDVTAYDLRRTTASWLANHGVNLSTIQCILNHATLQATHRYARLDVQTAGRALETITKVMTASNPFLAQLCAPLTCEDLSPETQASRAAWEEPAKAVSKTPVSTNPPEADPPDMDFPG